jgi:hypothetical protein
MKVAFHFLTIKKYNMKKILKKTSVITAMLMAFSLVLFSFKTPFGGDRFTIHLNNKLVLEQFMHIDKTVKSITLDAANANDELRVSYSHCGVVGKSRVLIIKDQNDKVLKQWRYEDSKGSMTFKVKDILSMEKGNTTLRLFYSSAEMPKEQALVSFVTGKDNKITKS